MRRVLLVLLLVSLVLAIVMSVAIATAVPPSSVPPTVNPAPSAGTHPAEQADDTGGQAGCVFDPFVVPPTDLPATPDCGQP